jgi:hypothetical protein
MWQRSRPERQRGWVAHAVSVFLTFQFVCLAWVFFRAPTFAHATLMLGRIARGTTGTANLAPRVFALVVAGLVLHWFPDGWTERLRERFVRWPAVAQGVCLALTAYALHLVAGAKAEPFVYGQF